jgi:hypothetical protein
MGEVPPLPERGGGDGYDWLDRLDGGWHAIAGWGRDGWDLGDWPLVVVAHFNGRCLFAVGVYIEGDVEVQAFTTREERDVATDEIATIWWRRQENGPEDLPPEGGGLLPHHRGHYRIGRP